MSSQTNYCTLFPDHSYFLDWQHCCKKHDIDYTGTEERAVADKELFNCVYDSSDGILVIPALIVGCVMFLGVRAFGKSFYKKD